MDSILIFGAGRHAQVVRDCLSGSVYRVAGYIDDSLAAGTLVEDLPVLGPVSRLAALVDHHAISGGIIAIGANYVRETIVNRVSAQLPDFRWIAAVHGTAIVAPTASIGEGSIVAAGSIIGVHAAIGRHCLINTGSRIDHDTVVKDFASTGPGVVTGGNVCIGARSHLGIGAVLSHGVAVGNDSVVGGNTYVSGNLGSNGVFYGTPARFVRSRDTDSRYL